MLRRWVKSLAFAAATLCVLPELLSYRLRSVFLGRDRAFQNSCQTLALIPGLLGQMLRRAFLCRTLARCHGSVTVEWGACLTKVDSVIDAGVYIGPSCQLGLVHLERDVLLAAGVHVPSGAQTHGFAQSGVPIRDQPGQQRRVRIGAGSWIGSGAVVMTDVGCNAVVGAGAVVTRPVDDWVVAAGVPAQAVKSRKSNTAEVS